MGSPFTVQFSFSILSLIIAFFFLFFFFLSLLLKPSIPVYKISATLMLVARTWDQIGTIVHAKKATTGMAKCAYQLTPARFTLETALQSLQCANTMGPDR